MNFVFQIILAVVPGLSIALYIHFRDKYEPEPVRLLVLSFLLGIVSMFIAWGLTTVVEQYISIDESDWEDQAVHAFLIVAIIEEVSKFLFARGVLFYNSNFDEPFDGIVYTVMIGMGFATAENILYVVENGGSAAIIRMFTAVPAHGLFAILMGYFLGKAKFQESQIGYYSFIALFVATLFHGTYDYFLFISFIPGLWVGAVVAFGLAFFLARKAIRIHQQASPFRRKE
ncbi:MAG: PrsW family intramembrane metalloprotease [Flammeovirgaceae bacterium]|nr:PrsW family intramembrane metalloprotease [Flammeovirgaceae bacterium]